MQELMDALRALGTKLGMAVEELAPHAVAYERANAFSGLLMAIPLLIVAGVGSWAVWKLSARLQKDAAAMGSEEPKKYLVEEARGAQIGGWIVLLFFFFIASLVVSNYLPTVLEPTGRLVHKLMRIP